MSRFVVMGTTEYKELREIVGFDDAGAMLDVFAEHIHEGWAVVETKIEDGTDMGGERIEVGEQKMEVRVWVLERELSERWKSRI